MKMWKWILVTALTLASANALAFEKGKNLSAISIKKYGEGHPLDNNSFKGKVTVINFWATWCGSCKTELGEMQAQFQKEFSGGNVQVAFVSMDKDPEMAVKHLKAKKADYILGRLFVDPTFKTAEELGVDSFPLTLVIDPNGRVAYVVRGFKKGEDSTGNIVKQVKSLLQESKLTMR